MKIAAVAAAEVVAVVASAAVVVAAVAAVVAAVGIAAAAVVMAAVAAATATLAGNLRIPLQTTGDPLAKALPAQEQNPSRGRFTLWSDA